MIKHWCDVCNDEMTEEIYYFEVRIEAKAPCGIPLYKPELYKEYRSLELCGNCNYLLRGRIDKAEADLKIEIAERKIATTIGTKEKV